MTEEVATLRGREAWQGRGDQGTDVIERPRAGRAQERFQFGEREFDGIQIRAVGRQKPQGRPRPGDRGVDLGLFVDGEVIEHDDIARAQGRDEHLLDVGEKRRIVHGAVKDGGGAQPLESERGHDGVRLPVTTGRVIAQARAQRTSPIAPQQIGGHAAFVEKDVLAHVAQRLPGAPAAARGGDIRAALFVRVYRFF